MFFFFFKSLMVTKKLLRGEGGGDKILYAPIGSGYESNAVNLLYML